MNKFLYLSIFILACSILSCSHKNETLEPKVETKPGPTPFTLNLPLQFSNVKYTVPADNPNTNEGVDLGRMLFYEKQLSSDNTISCSSCHKQQFAFADTLSFSLGVNNKKGRRNAMSVVNLIFQDSTFFWDGRANSLEHQIIFPMHDSLEMNSNIDDVVAKLNNSSTYKSKFQAAFGTSTITSDLIFKALAQFERSIISTNSRFDQYILGQIKFTDQEKNGYALFRTHPIANSGIRGGNCGDCHNSTNFVEQIANFRNNGLDSVFKDLGREDFTNRPFDAGKFRIPSLRNIALTAPYMHDGRFSSLEEVLDHYNEHILKSGTLDPLVEAATNEIDGTSLALTAKEKEDIIAFLQTLTDESITTNTAYSNPFK